MGWRKNGTCCQNICWRSVYVLRLKLNVVPSLILGVNALSGEPTRSMEPPKFGVEQDYVVVGQQLWLDGIVSGPGVVRQVSKFLYIK